MLSVANAATTADVPTALEYAYFSHGGPGLPAKSIVDFAYQRDFGPNVQHDVEYGFEPTTLNGQRLHYVGAGLSFMH